VYNKLNGCSATGALALGPDYQQQQQHTPSPGCYYGQQLRKMRRKRKCKICLKKRKKHKKEV
jgi:hypothetical protein